LLEPFPAPWDELADVLREYADSAAMIAFTILLILINGDVTVD